MPNKPDNEALLQLITSFEKEAQDQRKNFFFKTALPNKHLESLFLIKKILTKEENYKNNLS